jgi:hypothetical protein
MRDTKMLMPRRQSLMTLTVALASMGAHLSASTPPAVAAGTKSLVPSGGHALDALTKRLAALPRRRDFKTSPMILERRDQWDAEALDAVLHYTAGPKQSWDNTDINGPWLNVMRNSMNAEIWSFQHPDFLCVSATHGTAQLALYDDAMWEKYGLAKLAGGNVTRNTFLAAPAAAVRDPKDFQNPDGPFSSHANSIQTLQQRGAVFLACHNAAWEVSERLITAGTNPDKLTIETLCAELTNHLIPGVVMTPGAVGTLVELAKSGFAYAR